MRTVTARESLLAWADQFENDHCVIEAYGEKYTADLDREKTEAAIDIAITLVDRVVAAKGDLLTSEYEELEAKVRREYPEDSACLLHIVLQVVSDDRLFGRYRDIEPMTAKLSPRGYPVRSAAYLLLVRPELYKLIYAVIRHMDVAEENCDSLVYTFFIGILAKGWGEGNGWKKTDEGSWRWTTEKEGK